MRKIGIALIHGGLVSLLAGQLLTDFLAIESSMHIRNGGTTNFSEADRSYELAVVDTSDAESDKVVAIPGNILLKRGEISVADLPFTVRVKSFFHNSSLTQESA